MAERVKLRMRVEYDFEVDLEDFEDDDGETPGPEDICLTLHGLIKQDPRGVQDIIEDNATKRVTLSLTRA